MALTDVLGLKKRIHVGISISNNNSIELIRIDNGIKSVDKYVYGEIQYNSAIRELMAFDEFSQTLISLFDEAGLDPQECSVCLSLPNVHFGISNQDNQTDAVYIIDNLQSEIEDLYIFKRNEPVLSYDYVPDMITAGKNNIAYAAIQGKSVVKIIEIFDKLGIEIERIDNSYVAMLRGLRYCEKFAEVMSAGVKTLIIVVSANSLCSLTVNGEAIAECKESPLAIKSYSSEEVYSLVSKYTMDAIEQNAPQAVVLISETDDINAQLLTEKIDFSGNIVYVNKIATANDQLLDFNRIEIDAETSMISYLSLEAIGSAVHRFDDYLGSINFLPRERISKNIIEIGEYEVDWTKFFFEVVVIAFLFGVIIGFIIASIFNMMKNSSFERNTANSLEIKNLEERMRKKDNGSSQRVIAPIIKQTLDNNKFILNTYIGLSTEIPENVYIKRFITNSNGGIALTGESRSSEAVESFVNKLKDKNTSLMVSRLSVNSPNDVNVRIPNGFSFAIKTSAGDINIDDNPYGADSALDGMMQQLPSKFDAASQDTMNNSNAQGYPAPPPPPVI